MIAWVGYQRRADTMKQYWAYNIVHLPNQFRNKYLRPLDYFLKSLKTLKALIWQAPDIVWVQLPPSPLIHITLTYRLLFNRQLKIIADGHNSLLREQWITFPGTLTLLNKIDAVVVHNFKVQEELLAHGVQAGKIFVLEDLPCDFDAPAPKDHATPYVLFPCSFDIDEPVDVVLESARSIPHVRFFVTGRYQGKVPQTLVDSAPSNVTFTGFLSKPEFEALLCSADVVLGLTTRDNVQLSVANEAVSAGRPMALSDTTVLRSLFCDAAVFVDTLDPVSIKNGILQLVADTEGYAKKSALLKIKRIALWKSKAELLKSVIHTD